MKEEIEQILEEWDESEKDLLIDKLDIAKDILKENNLLKEFEGVINELFEE